MIIYTRHAGILHYTTNDQFSVHGVMHKNAAELLLLTLFLFFSFRLLITYKRLGKLGVASSSVSCIISRRCTVRFRRKVHQ